MLLKFGVDISRLKRPLRRKLCDIDNIHRKTLGTEAVITSTYEGTHGLSSLHYSNEAIDIRKHSKKVYAERFFTALKKEIGKDFDIVLESTHIHIEYDPKEKR